MPCRTRRATWFFHSHRPQARQLQRRAHLEMSPLVPISELDRNALLKRRAYLHSVLFGESLTLARRDDQRAAYGIPSESSRSEVGCAAAPTLAKGAALTFLLSGGSGGSPAAYPLPL